MADIAMKTAFARLPLTTSRIKGKKRELPAGGYLKKLWRILLEGRFTGCTT